LAGKARLKVLVDVWLQLWWYRGHLVVDQPSLSSDWARVTATLQTEKQNLAPAPVAGGVACRLKQHTDVDHPFDTVDVPHVIGWRTHLSASSSWLRPRERGGRGHPSGRVDVFAD
jgi:hypothetical protein